MFLIALCLGRKELDEFNTFVDVSQFSLMQQTVSFVSFNSYTGDYSYNLFMFISLAIVYSSCSSYLNVIMHLICGNN